MNRKEGTFKGIRDLNIYHQAWLPENGIKAAILIVHGLGEHCGRYANVVNYLVPQGYAVYALDHIGHGKSAGEREFVKVFDDYTDNLAIFKEMVKADQPGKPVFLLGHSMGGLISTYFLLDNSEDFQGAIISAPAITVPENITQTTIVMAKLLSKITPKMGMLQLDANQISKDPEVVRVYLDDPLVFNGKTPVRLMAELLKAMIRVNEEFEKISLPVLLVHGNEDKLAQPAGSKNLYKNVSSVDKTLKIYDGLFHEVFNEPERDQVLSDVAAWLDAHL